MEIDWSNIQTHWDWAGHVLEAAVMSAAVTLLIRIFLPWRSALLVGVAFAAGHFHGREKRDYELSVQMLPPHLEGYFFWKWSWDQATDFWPVAIVCFVALLVINRRHST
ncbi:MAG: hypothetical protein ACK4RZ_05225 [Paracoccaceae bacterium]